MTAASARNPSLLERSYLTTWTFAYTATLIRTHQRLPILQLLLSLLVRSLLMHLRLALERVWDTVVSRTQWHLSVCPRLPRQSLVALTLAVQHRSLTGNS